MSARLNDTMFAALYGELVPHSWRDAHVAASDAYSLFVARSSAMGWLTQATVDASGTPDPDEVDSGATAHSRSVPQPAPAPVDRLATPACGAWSMNDAGSVVEPNGDSRSRPTPVAWFQVSLPLPPPPDRPLPVQPFLACVDDVVASIGTADLRAVQLLLPGRAGDATPGTPRGLRTAQVLPGQTGDATPGTPPGLDIVGALLQDAGWFADVDPRRRTQMRITVDSGQDPSIPAAASEMLRWIRRFKQDVFLCDAVSVDDEELVDMEAAPAVGDVLWRGPAQHRATFRGALPEWSLDTVGWSAAWLAEAAAQCGVFGPLLITASRSRV